MRQLTCTAPGKLEWHDVPAPKLEADVEALVRPLAVARCDIDLFLAAGLLGSSGPFAVGHECVGEIVALGDAVQALAVGDRVIVSFQLCCGECGTCKRGHTALCERYPVLSDYGMQPHHHARSRLGRRAASVARAIDQAGCEASLRASVRHANR